MTTQLWVPDEAVRYILFQRTEYSVTPLTLLYRHLLNRLPFPVPLYTLVLPIEARLRKRSIKALYARDMAREYASIEPFLPSRCSAVLDIGCGVAGIDALLHRHYAQGRPAQQGPEIYLLDKTQVETSVYYMFKRRGAFYNSLPVARGLLVENGVPSSRAHLLEATSTNEIAVPGQVELVISLISWGFHYPVDTYADRVRDLLADDGVVILDVRKGTDGVDALRRRFARVDTVFEREKWWRVAASR